MHSFARSVVRPVIHPYINASMQFAQELYKTNLQKMWIPPEENERMRDNTQVGALQRKLSKAEELLKVRNGDIKTLKEQLSVGTEELSKVAEKFVDLEDNFNEQLQSRVKAESRKITSLEVRMWSTSRRAEGSLAGMTMTATRQK